MIQIKHERCPLETSYKLQLSSVRPFKVLQMIESNNYIFKLPLNFDINFTFDMKTLIIYKTQQTISYVSFETLTLLSLSLAKNEHINVIVNAQVVSTRDNKR
jgi:hypothetical protein